MYEIGKLTGDKPGEAQFLGSSGRRSWIGVFWRFRSASYELRMNDAGLLLICTGGGVTQFKHLHHGTRSRPRAST